MNLIGRKKSIIIALVAGVIMFMVLGCLTIIGAPRESAASKTPEMFEYVAAKKSIAMGSKITIDDIEVKSSAANIAGTYKSIAEVEGKEAKRDIAPGSPIMPDFVKQSIIEEVKVKDDGIDIKPRRGFRAVPILVRKNDLMPSVKAGGLFDLFTKEGLIKIENVRILSIIDPPNESSSNKMLILEIRSEDMPMFITQMVHTSGFVFLNKNPEEFGEYKFNIRYSESMDDALANMEDLKTFKGPKDPVNIPPVENLEKEDFQKIENIANISPEEIKEVKKVEIIVGNKKTTLEFSE